MRGGIEGLVLYVCVAGGVGGGEVGCGVITANHNPNAPRRTHASIKQALSVKEQKQGSTKWP